MLVPLRLTVAMFDEMETLWTFTPGAKTSTMAPKLEKLAFWSLLASIAPTVMAAGAEAGDVLPASCCVFF